MEWFFCEICGHQEIGTYNPITCPTCLENSMTWEEGYDASEYSYNTPWDLLDDEVY